VVQEVKLIRTPAQRSDYNLKLTKAELISIHQTRDLYDRSSEEFRIWNDIIALISREVERLGYSSSKPGT